MSFVPLLGMAVLLGIAYLLSSMRSAIRFRTVSLAFAIQLSIGALVLFAPAGRSALAWLAEQVQKVINCADEGIAFLFGSLADIGPEGPGLGFIFVVKVLPVIIFFSSLIAVLYHLGVMQFVIRFLGGALRAALRTSKAESLSATANIFVGQTEAPLVVRPYIPRMTRSELFAIMVGGLASIAGSVLVGYSQMGVKLEYLLAACFMAAPGGLLFAKLVMPETEEPDENIDIEEDAEAVQNRPANVIDAAALGASSGLKLALNVGAMLLAFVSIIALVNLLFGTVGGWFGHPGLTLEFLLGEAFSPAAWMLGIPWEEASTGGSFIGQKLILNEFVAYKEFVAVQASLTPVTQGIITFALCGFANLSSIAILLGGIGVMAPTRRAEIAKYGLKAVLAASLANLMSAAIAGFFLPFVLE